MNSTPKRRKSYHILAVTSFGLAFVSLVLLIVGSNRNSWAVVNIHDMNSVLDPLELSEEDVHFHLHIGLEAFDIHASVSEEAVERGFFGKEDTYLWSILSVQCHRNPGIIARGTCDLVHEISSLSNIVYTLLSVAEAFVAAIIGFMVLAESPIVHLKKMYVFFGATIILILTAMIIYEVKLLYFMKDPRKFAIHHHDVHTTIAGVDASRNIPTSAVFKSQGLRTSQVLVWLAFALMIVSSIIFVVRVNRTKRNKKYLSDIHTLFMHGPSVRLPNQNSGSNGEIDELIKARRLSESD